MEGARGAPGGRWSGRVPRDRRDISHVPRQCGPAVTVVGDLEQTPGGKGGGGGGGIRGG